MTLEPAPTEREQLAARLKTIEKLNVLLSDLDKRFRRRTAQLLELTTHSGSGLAYTLGREAIIHMGTLNTVTSELTLEFIRFLEEEPMCRSAIHFDAMLLVQDTAVKELSDCVELMGVDDSGRFAKLALTILTKGLKVAGLVLPVDAPIIIAETVEALKDVIETSGIAKDEERMAARFLLRLEWTMMLSLSAAEYAAAVVHIWTNKKNPTSIDVSANADIAEARAYVRQTLKKVRLLASKDEAQALFTFPEEGLWLDTQYRRIQAAVEGARSPSK